MRALVTGATGFVGKRLLQFLDEPVVLSRNAESAKRVLGDRTRVLSWDPMSEAAPREAFAGVDTVFHLAGDPVAEGRWNEEKKRRIRDSRVIGTANLVRGIAAAESKPRVLVSASAIGYYGSRGDETLDEAAAASEGFLAEACVAWEREAAAAKQLGVRTAMGRIGLVLGDGGALKKMLLPFKLGLGGRLGDGRQWMSWVHVDDVVGMFLYAAREEGVRGPFNAVGPKPATNIDFTKALGRAVHRPTILPAPVFALRLAFGEFAEVPLGSQRCVPKRMLDAGYRFQYPTLDEALAAAVAGTSKPAGFVR
ncbi:MAG: TIGR01777 family oxidoreductase [Planctomycetia bacterium]|nr:TIGR01777 family oxidoreductase [Planctomycetia bacterium]